MVCNYIEDIAEKLTVEEFAGTFSKEKSNEDDKVKVGLGIKWNRNRNGNRNKME